MVDYQVERVLDIKAELGECPLWSVEDRCLYWLDIEASTINRFDPRARGNTAWTLPAAPGCFAFLARGGAVIAARDGIYEMDFATGGAKRIMAAAHDPAQLRFNDGRTDRQGRLWVGTVRADDDVYNTAENAYFRFDGRSLEKLIAPTGMTNGTAFSPDGRTMYRAQTEARRIFAHDYDPESGTPSRERVFAVVPDELGMPDGATVDTDGGYWVALPAPPPGLTGGIGRFTRDGRLDVYFEVPAPLPTMVAFGGPDMSTLYITTGRLAAMMPYQVPEAAGSIFAVETKFRGLPETPFRFR